MTDFAKVASYKSHSSSRIGPECQTSYLRVLPFTYGRRPQDPQGERRTGENLCSDSWEV
jgi:hypothetical protein